MQDIQTIVISLLQLSIAFGLINVWIVRFNRATKYRGGKAKNMKEEFSAYGLPSWSMYVVGFLKLVIAAGMVLVAFNSALQMMIGTPLLLLLVVLMLGAITMHIKVKDTLIKIVPAITMLLLSVVTLYLTVIL